MKASAAFLLAYYYPETRRLGYDRWGFKEVRHDARAARFLLSCFPAARVIFLVRHLADVLASNAVNDWVATIGGVRGVASTWVRNVRSFMREKDTRILVVRYEDLVQQSASVCRKIKEHLALTGDFDTSLLSRPVGASVVQPRLGPAEREMLSKRGVSNILNEVYR
jgi:hypothetical protein